ncbi:MAG: glycosyl hydrolase, partial [Gammaproteobacteria bacterium]|nr:glycosyl hydrolase [Gammaproteobacteria bacterium]
MKMKSSCSAFPLALALIVPLALAPLAATPAQAQDAETISAALGDIEWRHIGPVNMGGRVSAIIGVPGDARTFWVGAANGGVWKTTNGGVTFEHQWDDEHTYSVGALTLAPSDHNVLWLGAGEADPRNSVSYGDGVYRSTDGGATWTHLGLDDSERIKRIVVDPRDPDVALVCAMGHEWGPNRERGVFRTTDGGQSWEHVLFIDEDTGCSDMDIDLTNPRNVYAGMWTFRRQPWRFDDGGKETALYVSRDGGISWKKITTTPDEPMARIGVSVAQSRPNIVYLITEYPTAGTLFMSDDYGETWTMVNDNKNLINFRPFYYSDVYADPSDHETLYTLSGALAKSTDGGRTFERIANDVHGDHQAYWIDPVDGERVLSGSDGGMQVSYDGGANFHIFRNFSLAQYYHI